MRVSWPPALLKRKQTPRPRWRRFCWNGCGFSVSVGDRVTACCPTCRVGFVTRPVDERGRELHTVKDDRLEVR